MKSVSGEEFTLGTLSEYKDMEKILIGKIVNAVGLKGEVKIYNYSDSHEIYENTNAVYVDDELMKVQRVRLQKNMVILKLEGIDDRNEAERAKGREIFVTEDDLPELEEGEYYIRDLIGMEVVLEDGSHLGTMTDVLQNSPQDIFQLVTENGKEVLIPRVPEFVIDINTDERKITVRLIEGMLEL